MNHSFYNCAENIEDRNEWSCEHCQNYHVESLRCVFICKIKEVANSSWNFFRLNLFLKDSPISRLISSLSNETFSPLSNRFWQRSCNLIPTIYRADDSASVSMTTRNGHESVSARRNRGNCATKFRPLAKYLGHSDFRELERDWLATNIRRSFKDVQQFLPIGQRSYSLVPLKLPPGSRTLIPTERFLWSICGSSGPRSNRDYYFCFYWC